MDIEEKGKPSNYYFDACIVMIWLTALYSGILQYVLFKVPNGMLLLGIAVLLTFLLYHNANHFDFHRLLTKESRYMLVFMAYMLVIGFLFALDRKSHISQWVTCMEYLFLLVVISSMIKDTGTNTFHVLLFFKAVLLAAVFLWRPVYYAGNRYSISLEVNPNGLGMGFATGIWAVLYRQQEKKLNLIFSGALIVLFGYCIIMTGSRKSLIAAGLTIILWMVFCFLPSLKERGVLQGIFAIIILVILVVVITQEFLKTYENSEIASRMDNLLNETTEGKRSTMYREGFEMLEKNPLFGFGFQGFAYVYGLYSHATLVEIPVSGGIVGTIIYFIPYFISIKKSILLFRKTKNNHELISCHTRVKMILILWTVMMFYTTCIIHQYQIESFMLFGLIFGETAYIEHKIVCNSKIPEVKIPEKMQIGSKYIRV